MTVEADRAQRGRDLGDEDEVRRALGDIELLLVRVEAGGDERPPGRGALAGDARGPTPRARRASDDPRCGAAAAEAWTALERPYPAALARWREAEAHVAAGDRDARPRRAARGARRPRAARRRRGWPARSRASRPAPGCGSTTDDARGGRAGRAPTEDPFGLTPRERQVLALVARGATNREIGAQLYMAEKTASVHVSRILAKLDVRSRTEAAAVAHRLGLAE